MTDYQVLAERTVGPTFAEDIEPTPNMRVPPIGNGKDIVNLAVRIWGSRVGLGRRPKIWCKRDGSGSSSW